VVLGIALLLIGSGLSVFAGLSAPTWPEASLNRFTAGWQPTPARVAAEIAAMRGGPPASCNFDVGGLLAEITILGNIAIRTGRRLEWDGEKEEIFGSRHGPYTSLLPAAVRQYIDGGLPYRDVFEHKPPVGFYVHALGLLFVPPTAVGMHLFLHAYNFATLVVLFFGAIAGATWINDISAGRFDPEVADVAAQRQCPVVLMHSRDTPKTMQEQPSYRNVVAEVKSELQQGIDRFVKRGVARENIVLDPGLFFRMTTVITLTGGTIFLMWLGEQITERGVGNGISLIIFAGIVAGLPRAVAGTLELVNTGQLSIPAVLIILTLVLAVVYFIVRVERGQRRITVNYAQRQGRVAYQNQATHLPLKVNMSGVIPAIFASSIVIFPSTLATWFSGSEGLSFLTDVSAALTPGNLAYTILYSGLIIFFCFFYTAMVFNSKETADNLKRSGAFIPGIRPGRQTAEYIDFVLTRLTMVGSVYLVAVCLLPDIFRVLWQVPFYFGGTSVLIVVVVIMDFIAQVQAHLISHQYDSLMKKANLRSYGRSGVVRR